MATVDLYSLQAGSSDAWDEVFAWLWPVAFGAAHARLAVTFPEEIEEVAIESLEAIAAQIAGVRTIHELPALVKAIANNRAISRWRELTAQKRDPGKTSSLDAPVKGGEDCPEPPSPSLSPVEELELKDLRELLDTLEAGLKPDFKAALNDFFLEQLSYQEISQKRGWPMGTVGVYVQRGLEAIRRQREKRPDLLKEAAAFLRMLFW